MNARTSIGLGAGTIAVAGAVAVKRGSMRAVDRAVRRRIHPRRSPRVTALAKGVSFLADPHLHPGVAAALGLLLRVERGRGGFAPSAASVASLAVDNAMRIFVHQRRPPKAGPHSKHHRYAYPSGHTTAATAIAVAVAAIIDKDISPSERMLLWATVVALAVSVGWSRLYLDEHWLDDVVGGWMAGTVIGLSAASLDAIIS